MNDQKTLAIDISHWRQVNWNEIPGDVKVVMIKATEGDYYIDDMMEQHVEGAL
jgi:GH25 family lysozyme M1 (1,4-beta-N-acetylmuramidase)